MERPIFVEILSKILLHEFIRQIPVIVRIFTNCKTKSRINPWQKQTDRRWKTHKSFHLFGKYIDLMFNIQVNVEYTWFTFSYKTKEKKNIKKKNLPKIGSINNLRKKTRFSIYFDRLMFAVQITSVPMVFFVRPETNIDQCTVLWRQSHKTHPLHSPNYSH